MGQGGVQGTDRHPHPVMRGCAVPTEQAGEDSDSSPGLLFVLWILSTLYNDLFVFYFL